MLKPGKNDIPVHVKIDGDELTALQQQCYLLAETYGLDDRIDNYQGKRPLRLYSWELEWLIDVLGLLETEKLRPRQLAERAALAALKTRLKAVYAEAYPELVSR